MTGCHQKRVNTLTRAHGLGYQLYWVKLADIDIYLQRDDPWGSSRSLAPYHYARGTTLLVTSFDPNIHENKTSPHSVKPQLWYFIQNVQNTYIRYDVTTLIKSSSKYEHRRPVVCNGLDRTRTNVFRLLGHHLGLLSDVLQDLGPKRSAHVAVFPQLSVHAQGFPCRCNRKVQNIPCLCTCVVNRKCAVCSQMCRWTLPGPEGIRGQ